MMVATMPKVLWARPYCCEGDADVLEERVGHVLEQRLADPEGDDEGQHDPDPRAVEVVDEGQRVGASPRRRAGA